MAGECIVMFRKLIVAAIMVFVSPFRPDFKVRPSAPGGRNPEPFIPWAWPWMDLEPAPLGEPRSHATEPSAQHLAPHAVPPLPGPADGVGGG